MTKSNNNDALAVVFPNSYDSVLPELASERLMASIPFAGRYRMVDFILSDLVNSGIDNIAMIVRKNYHSLMDHLGSGREWDLARKKGGLTIFPPYSEKNIKRYVGRVEALASVLPWLKSQKEKYVVMTDANVALNFDFKKLIEKHIESGADVTMTYVKRDFTEEFVQTNVMNGDMYYTFDLDGDHVTNIYMNLHEVGMQNMSLNMMVIERKLLTDVVTAASARGYVYFERDVLAPQIKYFNVRAYEYTGYYALINSMDSYFNENMRLLRGDNVDQLFEGGQIYTKVRDDNPTRYINGSSVKNVMVADGCIIEGTLENCILSRGVKIGKGAVVKNCILMQDTKVEAGAHLEYVITDKNVIISTDKELKGNESFQVFVEKGKWV